MENVQSTHYSEVNKYLIHYQFCKVSHLQNTGVCNFFRRHTSTVRDRIKKKIKTHIVLGLKLCIVFL